jgi:hypothetical protein
MKNKRDYRIDLKRSLLELPSMEAFVEVDGVFPGNNLLLPTGAGLLNHFHL